jgi:two-component system nitrate/nitrite response regulator NarL
MSQIRVLIADDHTLLRDALAELLNGDDGLRVVAAADSADEAVRQTAESRPDVVLLDIEMPGNERPLATIARLRQAAPGVRVLVLTMHDDPVLVQSILPSGISGFLHKSVTYQALAAAVHAICSPMAPVMVSLSAATLLLSAPGDASSVLSPREREVIELAAEGSSNRQIARRLGIVEGTVKRHMRSIFDKLKARSRVEAVNRAVEQGLIPPPVSAPRRRLRATHRPIPMPPPTDSTAPVM